MFEVLWNLECPIGLSLREICAHFNEGNLGCPPKKYCGVTGVLNLVGRK